MSVSSLTLCLSFPHPLVSSSPFFSLHPNPSFLSLFPPAPSSFPGQQFLPHLDPQPWGPATGRPPQRLLSLLPPPSLPAPYLIQPYSQMRACARFFSPLAPSCAPTHPDVTPSYGSPLSLATPATCPVAAATQPVGDGGGLRISFSPDPEGAPCVAPAASCQALAARIAKRRGGTWGRGEPRGGANMRTADRDASACP